MIHEEIVTFEVAKLAKEKGFPQDPDKNDYCLMYCWDGLRNIHPLAMWIVWEMEEYDHDNLYAAPTQSLLQRWLREEKKIHINICAANSWNIERTDGNILLSHNNHDYISTHISSLDVMWDDNKGCFDTYELALEDALAYSLKNLV